MLTILLLNSLHVLLGITPPGDPGINADEIAGIGLGAAAFVGAVGYFILRWRHSRGK